MIDFLIKSGISLAIFLSFYHLVLEREKMHRFNRFYLLSTIVISLVLPFITFEFVKIIPAAQQIERLTSIPVSFEAVPETIDYTPIILWMLYGLVTFAMCVRFGKNIWKLISKSNSNPKVSYKNAQLVLVDEKAIPHTFLNNIFINVDDYNNRNIEAELYTHELAHVTQKHTLDILFIEFLKTIFWFNPVFVFYKKAVQLNHEFLADEKVVECCNDIPFYQNLLLQKGTETVYLASNLNYLVTKKRLIMMTKNHSKNSAILRKIAIVPVLAGLIFSICFKVVAQEKATVAKPTDGNKDKIRDNYYSGVRIILNDTRTNLKIDKMYEELTLEQKRSYLDWVPDIMIEKEIPEALFERMKTKNLAVWIDNRVSSKEEISKHKRSDFSYYSYSFVHKNARSKRFPQEYQYTLYTKDYFDKNLKNSHLHFSNDTLKIGVCDWKKADKITKLLNTPKADTVIWYTQDEKKEYNLYINDPSEKKKMPVTTDQENPVYDPKGLTEKPDFEGGMTAFYNYIAANYKIPEGFKNKMNGKIVVTFIIEKDGSLSDIKVIKDMGYGTGDEAKRILKDSPKWKPGKMNQTPVRTLYALPITIASK